LGRPNNKGLISEVKTYENAILMSEIEGRGGQGNITGLNGLLLGVARKRSIEAICVMGEIPVYLQGFPFPYPKASKSVLEVLTAALGIEIDMERIASFIERSDKEIEQLYEKFPPEIKEQLDKLKYVSYDKPTEPTPITEEDKKRILEDIDKFFKKEPKED
jgi:proteasome assembly chaperone (PAC2) family protein